jgi:hypothetical protein
LKATAGDEGFRFAASSPLDATEGRSVGSPPVAPDSHPPDTRRAYLRRAQQLRAQAAEAREVAFLIERTDLRLRMVAVAWDWDRKAEELEQLARDTS